MAYFRPFFCLDFGVHYNVQDITFVLGGKPKFLQSVCCDSSRKRFSKLIYDLNEIAWCSHIRVFISHDFPPVFVMQSLILRFLYFKRPNYAFDRICGLTTILNTSYHVSPV